MVYIWDESIVQRDHRGMLPSRGFPLASLLLVLTREARGHFRQRSTHFSEIARIETCGTSRLRDIKMGFFSRSFLVYLYQYRLSSGFRTSVSKMLSSLSWKSFLKPAHLGVTIFALCSNLQTVSADLPSSKRFDLSTPSYDLFRNKVLKDSTVQQGFAFDNTNRRLFVAQRGDGSSETSGDLCITQLDFDGNYVGHMYLTGFGHGVSFGAQAEGSSTYLWTEVEANSNGYGTKLARFKFTSGSKLSSSSSSLKKFQPIAAATEHTCAIDPVNNRLIVRYNLSGKHIAVFDLTKATSGDFTSPLANFKHPPVNTKSDTFQGYAAYGQYIYLLTGNSYDTSGGVVNSEITSVNINTGAVVQGSTLTKAGSTLEFREPEGSAIYKTVGGEVRLFLGFASGKGGDRRSNLFYKNVLI